MSYVAVVIDNNSHDLLQSVELLTQSRVFEKIIPFENPEEAMEYIDNYGCDVVFTEIEMKKWDGFYLGRKYGKRNLAMCFVFLTANESYAIEAINLQVTDFVIKPIQENAIKRIVKKIKNKQYYEMI